MADPVNLSLSVMLTVIQTMEKEVTKIDKEIGKIMKSVPETLSSVKGIGPVFAAGIIAEIGDINRFDNHNALAKYTGLVWSQYQSENLKAMKLSDYVPATSICVTIWYKLPTLFVAMIVITPPFMLKSILKL
ncbi:transposase [Dehalobacterium formicoaceticum]|uniref:Transposase n=1 Tax=Dehalobacterium formicoaceticum TaxID=51515 RepID=A0ABT1Y9S2_9FIRM|nr:transposase [Dehalobacterium formicoaceticum]MCR6546401.1 transposase [Dehalobacterium formicoaceticum]